MTWPTSSVSFSLYGSIVEKDQVNLKETKFSGERGAKELLRILEHDGVLS
jgi:hypothetical protein